MIKVEVAENGVQAQRIVYEMESQGYVRDLIYLFALNELRSENLSDWMSTGDMSLMEVGFGEAFENFLRPRDRELVSMLTALGVDHHTAFKLEEELEQGRIVIVAVQR